MTSIPLIGPLQRLVFNLVHRSDTRRTCSRCGSDRFERLPRDTFARRHLLPLFNLYPWRCVLCGRIIPRTLRANSQDRADWR